MCIILIAGFKTVLQACRGQIFSEFRPNGPNSFPYPSQTPPIRVGFLRRHPKQVPSFRPFDQGLPLHRRLQMLTGSKSPLFFQLIGYASVSLLPWQDEDPLDGEGLIDTIYMPSLFFDFSVFTICCIKKALFQSLSLFFCKCSGDKLFAAECE